MQIRKDFDYYQNLHGLVTDALLHLLCQVSIHTRRVTTQARNEILVRYLKPKLKDKRLANVKKDIKLMLITGRKNGSNLEMKLYDINEQAKKTDLASVEKLYSLLVYLDDQHAIPSRLHSEEETIESGVLYLLQEHIEACFNDEQRQVAPISMLIQSENGPGLVDAIHAHGWFQAEVKEWNPDTAQTHLLVHPKEIS